LKSTDLQAERFSVQIRIGSLKNLGDLMLKKLLVALIASAFALGAYAQAQKAEPAAPKGQTGTATQKATPATPPSTSAKGDVKAEAKTNGDKKAAKKPAKKTAKAKTEAKATKTEAKKETK